MDVFQIKSPFLFAIIVNKTQFIDNDANNNLI